MKHSCISSEYFILQDDDVDHNQIIGWKRTRDQAFILPNS